MADDDLIEARDRIEELLDDGPRSLVFASHEGGGVNLVHRDRDAAIAGQQLTELIAAQIDYMSNSSDASVEEIAVEAAKIAIKSQ